MPALRAFLKLLAILVNATGEGAFFNISRKEFLIYAGRMRKVMDIGKCVIERKTLRRARVQKSSLVWASTLLLWSKRNRCRGCLLQCIK